MLADEVLNTWFDFLPSKNSWIRKFYKNADRMGMFTRPKSVFWFPLESRQQNSNLISERSFSRTKQNGEKRCGRYDPNAVDTHGVPTRKKRSERIRRAEEGFDEFDDLIRLDRENPRVAIKQITMGFTKWAQRYIGTCRSQKLNSFHVNRMNKWNNALQMHLLAHSIDI